MTEVTVESLTAELQQVAEMAEKAGDFMAAGEAIMCIAKLQGLVVERRIIEHVGMDKEVALAVLSQGDRGVSQRLRAVAAGGVLARHVGRRLVEGEPTQPSG